jgi:hypothetical protein
VTAADDLLAVTAMRLTADRYAMAVDRGDGALFAAQFTPDGSLDAPRGRFVGREQLSGVPPMVKGLYERTHHAVVGLVPEIEGAEASVQTYTHARHYYRDKSGIEHCYEMTVRYDDRFRLMDGRWLISSRQFVLVGDTTYPTGRLHRAGPASTAKGESR